MQAEPYAPQPIDTSAIRLTPEVESVLERLAENTHEIWAQRRLAEGWRPGPTRSDERKEHPNLIPYAQLREADKAYDRAVVRGAVAGLMALGYRIERA